MTELYLHTDPPENTVSATAPYNFVPLPERVLPAEAIHGGDDRDHPWLNHHRILDGCHSGHLDIELETKTPTFTRGACLLDRDLGRWDEREARRRPDPMAGPDGVPILPGSSIRGAVRGLFEILTFSKLAPITDKSRFYRTLPPARIGKFYQQQMVSGDEKPRGGYLRQEGDRWFIEPVEVVRVRHTELEDGDLPEPFRYRQKPNYRPQDGLHKQLVWFNTDRGGRAVGVVAAAEPGKRAGNLVLTGAVPKKKHEFIFCRDDDASLVEIPIEVWDDFNSDRQLSEWQQKRYPQGRDGRPVPGAAADGDPVFFLPASDGRVRFFGRAQMFRLPYDKSPADLLPDGHRGDTALDLAEAVFGSVQTEFAIKGRVSFSTAVASGPEPTGGWYEAPFVPKMLASPKPTCYPHYLVQDGNVGPERQTTYLADDRTSVRGHKLYWHRPTKNPVHLAENSDPKVTAAKVLEGHSDGRMHTVIKPVKAGVRFKGRIRFTNLTTVELGALLAAVQLPEGCAHRIGMAKSLGLGSVRITSSLVLVDPEARYRRQPKATESDSAEVVAHACLEAFENAVAMHAEASGEETSNVEAGLRRWRRLDSMYVMLDLANAPDVSRTANMEVGEFRSRKVLPSPSAVAGLGSTTAPLNRRPQAGQSSYQSPGSGSGGGRGRGNRRFQTKPKATREAVPDKRPKGLVAMTISDRKTKKGAPILQHETGTYVFAPNARPDGDLEPGTQVEVHVKSAASGPNAGQVEYRSVSSGDS